MKTRLVRGVLWLAIIVLATGSALAQDQEPTVDPAAPPSVEELQRQIEELTRQMAAMQKQLERLTAEHAAHEVQSEIDHLRQEAAAEAAREKLTEEVDTGTEFVSGTRMQPELNPEISVNGDVFLVAGDNLRSEMQPRHFELDFQSYLDPYTRMHVVFGYEGAHSVWDYGHERGLRRGARARRRRPRRLRPRRGLSELDQPAGQHLVDRRQETAAVRSAQPLAHARPSANRLPVGDRGELRRPRAGRHRRFGRVAHAPLVGRCQRTRGRGHERRQRGCFCRLRLAQADPARLSQELLGPERGFVLRVGPDRFARSDRSRRRRSITIFLRSTWCTTGIPSGASCTGASNSGRC